MRRALRTALPALMITFPGLKPWDLDRMTYGEVEELLRHIRKTAKQQRKAARSKRSRRRGHRG